MNDLLNYFTQYLKDWDVGRLLDRPDMDLPSDLIEGEGAGSLTNDEINFVKMLKKEVTRYGTCETERTDSVIDNFHISTFTLFVSQTDFPNNGVIICYKPTGDVDDWVFAPGDFDGDDFVLSADAGLVVGNTYDFRVQNVCSNGIVSKGFIIAGAVVEDDL